MKILGSTDFLGNPFGLLADMSEGLSELVHEGNVGGLVSSWTHGMANSTAKVTGKLALVAFKSYEEVILLSYLNYMYLNIVFLQKIFNYLC